MTTGTGDHDWDARLRAAGLRSTGQRRAVLAALSQLKHATVDELAAALQESAPDLSLSTVYRTLETLSEVGLVRHAHLHHGSPTYHEVDQEPHLHLVCRGCGRVGELPVGVAEGLAQQALQRLGFSTDLTHLVLHGWCRECQADDGPGSPKPHPVLPLP